MLIAPQHVFAQYQGDIFPGESHYYSILLRGNGEAVITTKIVYSHVATPITSASIQLPKTIHPQDLNIYQITQNNNCFPQYISPPALEGTPSSLNVPLYQPPFKQPCVIQNQNYIYIPKTAQYEKMQYTNSQNTIRFNFPTPIQQNGAYILYYRTFDITKKNIFSAFNFTFETGKVPEVISTLTLSITTDSDYYLREAKRGVFYAPNFLQPTFPNYPYQGKVTVDSGFNQYYNQIGQGTVTDTISQLGPSESYTISGTYADSKLKLYANTLVHTIAIILAILLGISLLFIFTFNKKNHKKVALKNQFPTMHKNVFFLSFGLSFSSMLLLAVFLISIGFIIKIFLPYGSYQIHLFFLSILMVFSCIITFILLLGPAVILTIQQGIKWGIITGIVTISFFIINLCITVAILFIFFPQSLSYRTYPGIPGSMPPVMQSGISSPAAY